MSWRRLLLAAIVLTSVRADAGVIYGCASNRTGRIRAVAIRVTACRTNETPVSWNQIGPPGPPGEPGVCPACPGETTTSTTSSTLATTATTVTTTSTLPGGAVCGNGVIEAGEACDCRNGAGGFCEPYPSNGTMFDTGGCPQDPEGRFQKCANDCSACLPTPRCGDGIRDPGDTCDFAYGTPNDQCGPGSRCTLTDPCRCFP